MHPAGIYKKEQKGYKQKMFGRLSNLHFYFTHASASVRIIWEVPLLFQGKTT